MRSWRTPAESSDASSRFSSPSSEDFISVFKENVSKELWGMLQTVRGNLCPGVGSRGLTEVDAVPDHLTF